MPPVSILSSTTSMDSSKTSSSATSLADPSAASTSRTGCTRAGSCLRGRRPRRPRLGRPSASDPVVRGLALWRRAVAGRWTVLGWVLLAMAAAAFPATPAAAAPIPEIQLPEAQLPEAQLLETPPCGLLVRTDEGAWSEAPNVETEVELRVTGTLVRARVTQRFTNPYERWVEGLYVFPLPEKAAVDGLRMILGDRIVEGQIREKEEAREVYERARREGNRASLVEQQRPNLFTTRVANLGPGEEMTVELRYQDTLQWDAGSFRLRFPMTLTPRYHPSPVENRLPPTVAPVLDSGPAHGGTVPSVSTVPTAQPPEPFQFSVGLALPRQAVARTTQAVGNALEHLFDPSPPVQALRLRVELEAGVPLATLRSSHHEIDVDELDGSRGRYEIELAHGTVSADRDFELVWRPELGNAPRSVVFTETLGLDTYGLLMVLPPALESSSWHRLPRETVFVLDVSGSMSGASIAQARQALLLALDRLQPGDSFNVLTFNSRTTALFPGSFPADPEVVDRAKAWVRGLEADGGTVMLPALLTALEGRPEGYGRAGARAVQQVIFITDGAVGNEDELFSAIERHLGEARLFTVGIGSAPNGHLLRRVAELGRGTFTYIGSPDQVLSRMGELFAKLESPVLTGVEVQWDDPAAEMYPARVPDLYAGEPVVVAAKLLQPGTEVRLAGVRDGTWWEETSSLVPQPPGSLFVPAGSAGSMDSIRRVSVATPAGDGPDEDRDTEEDRDTAEDTDTTGIAKLWARRKITALVDAWRRAPVTVESGAAQAPRLQGLSTGSVPLGRDELRRQVVELALAHHLVSRFTSLVAVDVTPVRPDGEPLASRAVPNVRPAGAAWEMPGFLPSGGTSARASLFLGLLLLSLALLLRRLLPSQRPAHEAVHEATRGGAGRPASDPGSNGA